MVQCLCWRYYLSEEQPICCSWHIDSINKWIAWLMLYWNCRTWWVNVFIPMETSSFSLEMCYLKHNKLIISTVVQIKKDQSRPATVKWLNFSSLFILLDRWYLIKNHTPNENIFFEIKKIKNDSDCFCSVYNLKFYYVSLR